MSNENDFYDILKNKFSNQEHPIDEQNWKAMRSMINASRAKKKRMAIYLGALALLLCAAGVTGVYEWNNGSTKPVSGNATSTITVSSSTSSTTKNIATSNLTSENTNPALGTASNANTPIAKQTSTHENASPIAANVNSTSFASSNIKKHDARKEKQISVQSHVIYNDNVTANGAEHTTKTNNLISSGNSAISAVANSPLPINSTPPIVPKSPPPPVAKTIAKAPDTIASEPQRFSDEPRIFDGEKQLFSIDAGTYYSFGWSPSLNISQGRGWNYVIGVGYAHYLKSKIFIKTGIQFSEFGNLSSYAYNYEHVSAQNPNLINDSVITTKRVYYLSVPLQFEKFIGNRKKSSIGLGGTLSYMLTTTASANAYQEIDNNPPAVNTHTYTNGIQLDGYNKWSASATCFYRYIFNRHISAYGMIYFMTPVENKAFFGEDLYLYNKGVKFLFSYTL